MDDETEKKIMDLVVGIKAVLDEFMKNLDNVDRRLRIIEEKFA